MMQSESVEKLLTEMDDLLREVDRGGVSPAAVITKHWPTLRAIAIQDSIFSGDEEPGALLAKLIYQLSLEQTPYGNWLKETCIDTPVPANDPLATVNPIEFWFVLATFCHYIHKDNKFFTESTGDLLKQAFGGDEWIPNRSGLILNFLNAVGKSEIPKYNPSRLNPNPVPRAPSQAAQGVPAKSAALSLQNPAPKAVQIPGSATPVPVQPLQGGAPREKPKPPKMAAQTSTTQNAAPSQKANPKAIDKTSSNASPHANPNTNPKSRATVFQPAKTPLKASAPYDTSWAKERLERGIETNLFHRRRVAAFKEAFMAMKSDEDCLALIENQLKCYGKEQRPELPEYLKQALGSSKFEALNKDFSAQWRKSAKGLFHRGYFHLLEDLKSELVQKSANPGQTI